MPIPVRAPIFAAVYRISDIVVQSSNPVLVVSPCIRHCTLDDNNYCLGCGRHVQEIQAWSSMTPTEQQVVRDRGAERCERQALQWQKVFK